jgi:recombinational DNA repair protein (RecF pathway)
MKQQVTVGIVLSRTNYGEADRIITVLTNTQGKLRLLAKGVRKIKSRMVGGIELFNVNDITYIVGRGEMGTLISARLKKGYTHIVKDVNRTMYAYEVLKTFNRITEDSPEPAYFTALGKCLEALNDQEVPLEFIRLWLSLQLLKLEGHAPNLVTDIKGQALVADANYLFSFDDMAFSASARGPFSSSHIKLLRLAERASSPLKLAKVQLDKTILPPTVQLAKAMLSQNSGIE